MAAAASRPMASPNARTSASCCLQRSATAGKAALPRCVREPSLAAGSDGWRVPRAKLHGDEPHTKQNRDVPYTLTVVCRRHILRRATCCIHGAPTRASAHRVIADATAQAEDPVHFNSRTVRCRMLPQRCGAQEAGARGDMNGLWRGIPSSRQDAALCRQDPRLWCTCRGRTL
jgi:hypothetical protein